MEKDLPDPSGRPYGVDTTSAGRLGSVADLASKEGVSESDPFYGQYLEGKEAGEKAKKEAEGKPSFDTQISDVFKNLGSNTVGEIVSGGTKGFANLTDQAIDAFKKASQTYAASVEAQFGFAVKPEDLRIRKERIDNLLSYEPIPSQIAQEFVQPFVTHTREVADKIYDSMSTYGKQAIKDSTATGDVIFYDTGIPTPGGGTLKLPVGIDNFSFGKNPTVFGTVLNVTGGLLDITIDVGLAFLGPAGLATSLALNTSEAAGAAAEQIERKVTEKLKDPEYLKGEEYQRALKKAGGNKELANAYLLQEAKSMLLATGAVGGIADTTVGKLIANRLTPGAVKMV